MPHDQYPQDPFAAVQQAPAPQLDPNADPFGPNATWGAAPQVDAAAQYSERPTFTYNQAPGFGRQDSYGQAPADYGELPTSWQPAQHGAPQNNPWETAGQAEQSTSTTVRGVLSQVAPGTVNRAEVVFNRLPEPARNVIRGTGRAAYEGALSAIKSEYTNPDGSIDKSEVLKTAVQAFVAPTTLKAKGVQIAQGALQGAREGGKQGFTEAARTQVQQAFAAYNQPPAPQPHDRPNDPFSPNARW